MLHPPSSSTWVTVAEDIAKRDCMSVGDQANRTNPCKKRPITYEYLGMIKNMCKESCPTKKDTTLCV